MEKRIAKVNISAAGGTATKGSRTCKVTLPSVWLDAMDIGGQRREVELTFDGQKIIIAQRLTAEEFAKQKQALGHDVRILRFYDEAELCSTIVADFTDETLTVENHITNPVKTAFGNHNLPVWDDFQAFLEERCIPRQRAGLREYLEAISVEEYTPMEIIRKTAGRMAEDSQWLEVEELK